MTILTEHITSEPAVSTVTPLTLWGYAPAALHDLFWSSKEVTVVRCGSPGPIPEDARLFMLISSGRLFRMHLRQMLERMFWVPRSVYIIGLTTPARHGAGQAPKLLATPARLALTLRRDIVAFWQAIGAGDNPWLLLRRRYPDFGSLRTPGLAYAEEGAEALNYLQMLARDWPDPRAALPNVARLGRGIYGPKNFDMSNIHNKTRPLWIGRGCSVIAQSVASVSPDVLPVARISSPETGRKI